jgi:Zn-dependent peptidase ImmA (M78 family)/DNA-binding XRE family transcriptional regulator
MTTMKRKSDKLPVSVFNGTRLQVAREFRGLTQEQLGGKVIASDTLVSMYEKGKKLDPPGDLVEAFADALSLRPNFFYAPLSDVFQDVECNFRHRRSAPERLKGKIRAHGTLIGVIIERLRTVLKFPKLNIPTFEATSDEEIELAAEKTRLYWSLDPDGPINHVGRVLEHAGVVIVSHIVNTTKIDAFSRRGQTTVVFLNRNITSTSRLHFDIGHECGHLVMHGQVRTGDPVTEAQADRFASAFLMPRKAFAREFRSTMTSFSWEGIFQLKRRWRVSAAAIVRRAYDLDLISAISYRQSYKYMSFKGWLKGEPAEPEFQEPELLNSALSALGEKVHLTLHDLCDELGFSISTFQDITGLAVPSTKAKNQFGVIEFPARFG